MGDEAKIISLACSDDPEPEKDLIYAPQFSSEHHPEA
jgi:hypothetical protein